MRGPLFRATFTPKGAPGPANGYPTQHGRFTVPLDQFHHIFTCVIYETDKPLSASGKRS